MSSAKPWPTLEKRAPEAIGPDHRVGSLPAELLGDLVRERLRALGVVRAQADVDEAPVELEGQLDREPAAVVVGAVDGVDGRAVGRRRDELLRLEVGRAEDGRFEPFRGRAGGDGVREVSGRGAGDRVEAELLRLRAVATATTRSLNECVGLAVSSLSQSSPTPIASASRGARTSGVSPGASRGSGGAATGRSCAYLQMLGGPASIALAAQRPRSFSQS